MSFRYLMFCCAFTCCFAVGCGSEPEAKKVDAGATTVVAEANPDEHAHGESHAEAHSDEHAAEAAHGDEGHEAESHAVAHATDNGHGGDAHDAHAATDGHGDSHGGGDHGGEYHDPYEDALHGNAGAGLEKPEEWKASLAIWSFVVFGMLLGILWKFAWGPICAALDQRESAVQANIDAAKEQNDKAAKLLADHEAKLAGTAEEVRSLLDNARKEAETQKASILAEAQKAADSEKNRALQEIAAAKNGALQELAEQSVDTAVGMAGSIVKKELKSDDHSSLISEALKHFPGMN